MAHDMNGMASLARGDSNHNLGKFESRVTMLTTSGIEDDALSEADSEEGYEPRFTKASFSDNFVFLPFNPLWRFFLMLLIVSLYSITLYELVFLRPFHFNRDVTLQIVKYICHVAYLIDTIAAILHRKKKSVAALRNYKPRPIWQIVVDGITLLPFDLIIDLSVESTIQRELRTVMLLVGCVRIYRIYVYFREFSNSVGLNLWLNVLQNFGTLMFLITHTLTCLLFWLADVKNGIWGVTEGLKPDSFHTEWYIVGLYYINTVFTSTGLGDLYSVNIVEHIIAIITMISGFTLITGVFLGAVTDVLVQSYRGHSIFWNKLNLIKLDLSTGNEPFSTVMIDRVMTFYKRFWVEKGAIKESFILTTLPYQMRGEVYVDMYWNAMQSCHIFRDLDISYKRQISRYMHSECFLEGDVILNQGALKCMMVYVVQGVIQILSREDSESPLIALSAGSCLGEASLLLSYPSAVEINAATYCELQMLDKKKLMELIREHPHLGREIYQAHSRQLARALQGIREKHTLDDENESSMPTVPKRALKEFKMALRNRDEIESRTAPFDWMSETEKIDLKSDEEKLAFIPVPNTIPHSALDQYRLSKSVKLSENDDVCLRTRWPWVFNPNSNIIDVWNWIIVSIVSCACVFIPYYVCFKRDHIFEVNSIFIIIDTFYWLDLYVHFTTALCLNGEFITSIFKIVSYKSQKLRTIIDIIATLPIEHAASSIFSFNNPLKFHVFRLNRVLKVHRVLLIFDKLQNGPLWDNTVVRVSKYIVFLLLGAFWMGAVFYMLACYADETCPDSWVRTLESKDDMALRSFYFAVVIISETGFGDIAPHTRQEMLFTIGFYIVGCLLFTYLIADFSSMIILKEMPRINFSQRVFAIIRFMEVNISDTTIRDRVNNFLLLQWHHRRGYFIMNDKPLFSDTPEIMRNWIVIWRRKRIFLGMDLFKGSDIKLIEKLCSVAESYALPPNETITFAGEVCREFYIVEEGFCESSSNLYKEVSVFGPYTSFNESEMVFEIPGFHHVRTLTHCKLLRVSQRNFKLILNQFPEFKETLLKIKSETVLDERTIPSVKHLRSAPDDDKMSQASSKTPSWITHRASTKQHPNLDYDMPFKHLNIYGFMRHILMRRTIFPSGKFLICWEVSRSIFSIMSALLFPPLAQMRTSLEELRYVALALDITAYVDLYVRMHVCYYSKEGLLVSHPWYTCKHYITHGFALDLFACFPLEMLFGSDGSSIRESKQIVAQNFLRLNRILQIHRISSLASYWEQDILNQYKSVVLLEFLPLTLALTNVLTCIYIWLHSTYSQDRANAPFTPSQGTWLAKIAAGNSTFSLDLNDAINYYLITCYWITSIMFTIGYGDIVPLTKSEIWYVIIVILLGYIVFTYVTVRVASSHANYNRNLTLYQEHMKELITFCNREKISRYLKREIIEHFENVWQKTRGLRPYQMFEKFHIQLKEDAAMHLYESTLTSNPLFKGAEKSFYRRLVVLVRERYFVSGAEVITLHDFVTNVQFVHHGELHAFDLAGEKRATLRKGNLFGNLERHKGIRLTMPIVASTNVLILVISSEHFFRLVDDYPNIAARFRGKESEELMFDSRVADSNPAPVSNSNISRLHFKSTFLRYLDALAPVAFMILVGASYLSCLLIAYHVAFQSENTPLWVIVSSYTLDALLLLRFVFGFLAPYKNDMGDVIDDRTMIKNKYMKDKFGFWLDVACSAPVDLFVFFAPVEDWYFTLACLRLKHLLRLFHIVKFFNIRFERLDVNVLLYKSTNLAMWFVVFAHFSTCVFYMIACPRQACIPGSWADVYRDICFESYYTCSLYLSVEIFTTSGVGNIASRTQSEIIFCIIVSTIHKFAIAVFIGSMSAIVANYSYTLVNYDFETKNLKYYLQNNPICVPLVNKVLKYVQMMWMGENGRQIPVFLAQTPAYLIERFNTEVYGNHLYENYIFSACDSDFLRQLTFYLRRYTFYPGNFVAQQGDMDNSLYFVHEGEVEVIAVGESSMDLVNVLTHGDTFGLRQGLGTNIPHDYTYRASAVSVILTLNYKHWEHLLSYFPGTRKDILSRVDSVVHAVIYTY